MIPRPTVCPVIVTLTRRALNLALMQHRGWDDAVANAIHDLVNTMDRR